MTFGFSLLTVGALMWLAGVRNTSIIGVLEGTLGGPGPGDRGFTAELSSAATSVLTGAGVAAVSGKLPKAGDLGKIEAKIQSEHPQLKAGIVTVLATIISFNPNAGIQIVSGYRPGDDGRHGEGRAVDIVSNNMPALARWIGKNFKRMLDEGIFNPDLSVDTHKKVPASFWGASTWEDHRDHIHLAV